jgi:predicted MFS family arabinose efflux permease
VQNKEGVSQHTGRSLFTRDFVLVFLAYLVFIAANYALIPTLPIYFTNLGSNARKVGVLIGVMAVAALISRFFVGGVLTKYSEKSAMLFGTGFFALTFPAAIVFFHFWPLFIVRVFQGIAFACFHTAAFAYAVNIIPPAHRAQGIAYFMLAPNLAMALAAPSGMFLFNQFGFTIFFLSCMSLSLCSFFLSWKVKGRKTIITPEQNTPVRNAFLPEWKIAVPATVNFMQIFVFGALSAFFPLYAFECGVTNPGLFFTTTAVVMITGRVVGGRILDTYNKEKMLLTFIFISMAAMVVLSFSKTLPMFIFVGLLWGAGATFFMPACMAYALEYAGSSSGAAVGTYQAFVDLGMALGPVMMGLIVPLTGYPVAFLCLAFLCLINLCYFQFYVRKKNNVALTV